MSGGAAPVVSSIMPTPTTESTAGSGIAPVVSRVIGIPSKGSLVCAPCFDAGAATASE